MDDKVSEPCHRFFVSRFRWIRVGGDGSDERVCTFLANGESRSHLSPVVDANVEVDAAEHIFHLLHVLLAQAPQYKVATQVT